MRPSAGGLRRREFITLIGGTAVTLGPPFAVRAQQTERVRLVGVLTFLTENDPEGQARANAFEQKLRDLGWTEGGNIRLEYRRTSDPEHTSTAAGELVRLTPDVILSYGTPALTALRRETRSIPIVFVQVTNPVGGGFVASLAHPGGNITGFTNFEFTIGAKWLATLKELTPGIQRVALL